MALAAFVVTRDGEPLQQTISPSPLVSLAAAVFPDPAPRSPREVAEAIEAAIAGGILRVWTYELRPGTGSEVEDF